MTGRLRVAVLISGRGSNLQALIASCADPAFPAEIVSVISNRSEAPGLGFAAAAGIPCAVIADGDRRGFAARADSLLREQGVELICLAGFMRVLSADFVGRWHDRILNIHPSLLPAFPGLHTHERALAAGVRLAGCTVHIVRPVVDDGPILVQAAVPVLDGDDAASLAARILVEEHRCYPLALRWVAEGRVRIEGGRVRIDGTDAAAGAIRNPL